MIKTNEKVYFNRYVALEGALMYGTSHKDHARVISIAPGENCGLKSCFGMKFWGVLFN